MAVSCDYAERVLPIFERRRPGDSRPRDLLSLLRKWLAYPQAVSLEEIREARRAAAYAAAYAANAANAAEQDWQRARLADYVLLEARP